MTCSKAPLKSNHCRQARKDLQDPSSLQGFKFVGIEFAGSDLTSFTKTGPRPDPKVIAHRSPATRGEMLVRKKTASECDQRGA